MDGFFYLLAQLGLLLGIAVVLAVLAGHYLWPTRPRTGPSAWAGGDTAAVVDDLGRRLTASEATVQELRTTVTTITDHKDTEMGRLESHAIQAMDSLIASHQERGHALQARLDTATSQARHQERELEAERRRTLRLQAALVERDERISALTSGLADRERRLRQPSTAPSSAATTAPPREVS